MKLNFDFSNPAKLLFIVSAFFISFTLPYVSKDAGITEDEPQHREHGKKLYDYYTKGDKTVIESPFDEKGQWKYFTEGTTSKTAINIYGGFFDFLAEVLHHTICKNYDAFEAKHALSAFFGALLFIFTALITQRISESWSVALLALVIATFTPRLFGYSLNNPKDIPLATFFAFSLLQMISFIKEMPRIRIRRAVLLALSFALAIAIRSGAVILIFYFLVFVVLYFALQFLYCDGEPKSFIQPLMVAVLISFAGYLGTSLFWPWAMQNPLLNPLRSLLVFKNFDTFIINELFEGNWINNKSLPWYFVPKWIYITTPVTIISGFVLFLILLPKFIRKQNWQITAYGLLLFSVAFPILSIIINHSSIYNSARHITFVIPSLIVLAALAWAEIFNAVKDIYLKFSVVVAFVIILSEPVLFIINNHPLQGLYFSPLIGGTKAAFKNYEMDYWGYSIRSAFNWIEKNDSTATEQNKGCVRMWYGEQLKLSYFADSSKRFKHVLAEENSADWDYFIELPSSGKFAPDIVYHWPPRGTVYEVMVDNAPICAVVKNYRLQQSALESNPAALTQNNKADPFNQAFNAGMNFYGQKNFNAAIVEFKKACALAPKNLLVVNNIVASLNELKMFDEAIVYATKGLKIDPNFSLLKNNFAETLKAKQSYHPDASYYINISYNYYVQGEFEKCIATSKMILKYEPNSFLAWNNICSAYNQLNQYDKAIDACNKGLKLAPTNELLRNNREVAVKAKAAN